MLMTQTEINNLLKQINGAFESLEVRVKALETKLEESKNVQGKRPKASKGGSVGVQQTEENA